MPTAQNECLDTSYVKKLTTAVALVIGDRFRARDVRNSPNLTHSRAA